MGARHAAERIRCGVGLALPDALFSFSSQAWVCALSLVRLTLTDYEPKLLGVATSGTWMRCPKKLTDDSITSGVPWIRMAMSWIVRNVFWPDFRSV